MNLEYGSPTDIENWMHLVDQIKLNFPGLEAEEKLHVHKTTVLKFMNKRQAICVKADGEIVGVLLFSKSRNMICCLGVAPDYRRLGVASMLMDEVLRNLDRTKEISVCTFRAEDEKGSAPRALYEKYGFIEDVLVEELGYPNQKYVLHPAGSERRERQMAINKMVYEIAGILSECNPSVYLYGSSVLEDFRLGWSDIDILILTERQITDEQAQKLVGLRQMMQKEEPDNPYYRLFEGGMLTLDAFVSKAHDRVVYWGTSGERITDTYSYNSFDLAEIVENGALLYGKDIRSKLKALGFNEMYADVKRHYENIRKYVQKTDGNLYSFGWLLDIAQCLYTLKTGKIIGKTAAGEWALENKFCPVPDALAFAVKVRRSPLEYKADEQTLDYAQTLAGQIQRFADVLEDELDTEAVIQHYDTLVDEGNDPVHDPQPLQEYMDKWDGAAFIEQMQLNNKKAVLEIGVGTGRLAVRTAPLCSVFYGIDISPETVKRAKKNLFSYENVTLICADFLSYKFNRSFDVVYSSLTFMHIEQKRKAVKKASELLNDGGIFVLSIDKNPAEFIDFGTRKLKIYPDKPEEIESYIKAAGMTTLNRYNTEFATIFTAQKDR